MSNPTVEELLTWMSDKSRTQGWSAIIAYDRNKANQLLTQLYIERFGGGSFLPSLSEQLDHGEGAINIEHVYDLTFAVPQLHFEAANLDDSRVQVSLDFVGGMIISEYRPSAGAPRIDKIQKVLPLNRPQLTMSVVLDDHDGQVGEDGGVTLDISNGRDYSANFVIGPLDQKEIGDRFKLYFEALLESGAVLYPLGTLVGENGVLTPESFALRTMAAPGADLRESENYRDGAVILFAKLRGGTAGGIPGSGSDFKYPIPADAGDKHYSGSMLLSSYTLFQSVFRGYVQSDIGNGITFKPSGSQDLANPLVALSGEIKYTGFVHHYKVRSDDFDAYFYCDPAIAFAIGPQPLTLGPNRTGVKLTWSGSQSSPFSRLIKWDIRDEWDYGDLKHEHNFQVNFDAQLDHDTGVVSFVRSPDSSLDLAITGHDWLPDLGADDQSLINDKVDAYFRPRLQAFLESLTAPEIDTFLARNLLFPGENALRLNGAYVPGDLYLPGEIDPQRTSIKITPLQPTMEAGGTQAFKTEPAITGVAWSVRATDDEDGNIGTINAQGVYTAAPASALIQGYQRVVVTASGKLDGKDVSSSAMVSVVETTVSVAPLFQVCDDDARGYTLTAETLSGKEPEWSLKDPSLGGTLSVVKGRECIYTPPPLNDDERPEAWADIVLVKNPDSQQVTEAVILVVNFRVNATVIISEDSEPATGKVQLQVVGKTSGPVNPIDAGFTCYLVSGPGTLSPEGLYTEPANASGIAVVSAVRENGPLAWNYIVMPLPLATYGELIRDVVDVMVHRDQGDAS